MAFKVERNEVYGDWQAVGRDPEDDQVYRCVCIRCGAKKLRPRKTLKKRPEHGCDEPLPSEVVSEKKQTGLVVVKTVQDALSGFSRLVDDDGDEGLKYSMFEGQVDLISGLLDEADSAEGVRRFQVISLKMLVDLVPYAEKAYRDDPKQSNAYTINALLTQIRELITDLTSEDDRGELIQTIMMEILRPAFLQMGQILLDNMYSLRNEIDGDVQPERTKRVKEAIDQSTRDMALAFQTLFYDIQKRVAEQVN